MDDWKTPDPWETYVYEAEIRKSSWVSLKDALQRLAVWHDSPQATAVEYLMSGLWSASYQRARVRRGVAKVSPKGGFKAQLSAAGHSWGGKHIDTVLSSGMLTKRFWHRQHAIAGVEWDFETGFLWPDGARIDIAKGEVEAFHGEFSEDVEESEFLAYRITAFGLGISESDVDATAPSATTTMKQGTRQTAFDWETAIADVAADFYFDLEFEDVNARGVQTEIIEALRKSFERRKLRVPELSSLKAKARILLGALRSKSR